MDPIEDLETQPYVTAGCARCGETHETDPPRRFRRSILSDGLWFHWWLPCPVTGDPVLVGLLEADGTSKSREELGW